MVHFKLNTLSEYTRTINVFKGNSGFRVPKVVGYSLAAISNIYFLKKP